MSDSVPIHSIRLVGPWEVQRPGEAVRVHLPRDWARIEPLLEGDRLCLRRKFHRPTGLDESTRVFVAMPEVWNIEAVRLNGEVLQESSSRRELLQRFELTERVATQESHELEIVLVLDEAARAAPFLVALEIEARG